MDDIKQALSPSFSETDISKLDKNVESYWTLDGNKYLPGIIGFNDASHASPINAILQALIRVPKLRNFFINQENYSKVC